METGALVFGSPLANEIAKQTKLLSRCEIVPCPECEGRGKVLQWDDIEEEDLLAKCWQCDGKGETLRDSDGFYYCYNFSVFERGRQWLKLSSPSLR